MFEDLAIPFTRVTYRAGQPLSSIDLNEDLQREKRLWRLHMRYLHDTWGIAAGLEVKKQDNKNVLIERGSAVDQEGYFLSVSEAALKPIPQFKGPEGLVLSVSRRVESTACSCASTFDPRSPGNSAGGMASADFSWLPPDRVHWGLQIPLAHAVLQDGEIRGDLDFQVRQYIRSLDQASFGWGLTEPGRSGWKVWSDEHQRDLGLELVVNTSEAGFSKSPHYFAVIHGDFSRHPIGSPLGSLEASSIGAQVSFPLNGFSFITEPNNDKFIYRLIGSNSLGFLSRVSPQEAEKRNWHIFWFGVEQRLNCQKGMTLDWILRGGAGVPWWL